MRFDAFRSNYLMGGLSVAVFLAVWEFFGRFAIIDPVFISYPSKVLVDGYALVVSGKITPHLAISVETILIGFSLAALTGSMAGVVIGYSQRLYALLRPYVYFLNAFPKIAIVPLVIIWFGVGIWSKIAIVFLMSLSSILISVIDGVRRIDSDILRMAQSFGMKRSSILTSIVLPATLPFVFSGMRIATGRAVIGLVVAEVFGRGTGLGYLLSFYGANFQTSRLMFVVFTLLTLNMLIVAIIYLLEKHVVKWK